MMDELQETLRELNKLPQNWDAERTIQALGNLSRLERLGVLSAEECQRFGRHIRATFRKQIGLPRIEGDPEV